MNINDGGQFSDDLIARILAMKAGSQSEDQLAQNEQKTKDAVQAGMNMAPAVGSLKIVGKAPMMGNLSGQAMYEAPNLGKNAANEGHEIISNMTKENPSEMPDRFKDLNDILNRYREP